MKTGPRWRAVILLLVLATCSMRAIARAQNTAFVTKKSPEFEIVSVKVNTGGDGRSMVSMSSAGYNSINQTLDMMLVGAYGLKTREMLTGLPGWAETTPFDVQAKRSPEDAAAYAKLSGAEKREQNGAMLQAMLADRFGLRVHHVTRELPAYALVIAKGGFKLKDADLEHPTVEGVKGPDGVSKPGYMMMGMGTFTGQAVELSSMAQNLAGWVHRQVVDRTGLTGKYDVSLKWTPDEMQGSGSASGGGSGMGAGGNGSNTAQGPSLMTALEEQLGLRLESIKLQTDTIVVDHIQMPSENYMRMQRRAKRIVSVLRVDGPNER